MTEAIIYDHVRTPRGRGKPDGSLHTATTLHLAATPKANGLFNIGSGGARSWIDLANAVFTALKKKPAIKFIEMPEVIRDKYQYFTQANLMRLNGTGYATPVTSLENAVHDYVRKYLVQDKRLDPAVP